MRKTISNTSPLLYLHCIGVLEWLPKLFDGPTGEGITSPISFSRIRRCVLKDAFRIV